jgi:hypothetical protein
VRERRSTGPEEQIERELLYAEEVQDVAAAGLEAEATEVVGDEVAAPGEDAAAETATPEPAAEVEQPLAEDAVAAEEPGDQPETAAQEEAPAADNEV